MKRLFDLLLSSLGLFLLTPLFLLLAVTIKLDSKGPVFFRQQRIGRHAKPFLIYKFRSMHTRAEQTGPQLTVGADARITTVGRLLRAYKIDELAQLINVVLGDMSLVGPRPEVPKYVQYYPAALRNKILSVRPGITDLASIAYKDENRILGNSPDPERDYIETILPVKLAFYAHYVDNQSLWLDLRIIIKTLAAILR